MLSLLKSQLRGEGSSRGRSATAKGLPEGLQAAAEVSRALSFVAQQLQYSAESPWTGPRSGLAKVLSAEIVDMILIEATDPTVRLLAKRPVAPPALATERHARQKLATLARRTLLSAALVCRGWSGPAGRRIALDLPVRITTRGQAERALASLYDTHTVGEARSFTTIEIAHPSPLWRLDSPTCCCEVERRPHMCVYGDLGVCCDCEDMIGAPIEKPYAAHEALCRARASRSSSHPNAHQIEDIIRVCQYATHVTLTNVLPSALTLDSTLISALRLLQCVTDFHCEAYDGVFGPAIMAAICGFERVKNICLIELASSEDSDGHSGDLAWPPEHREFDQPDHTPALSSSLQSITVTRVRTRGSGYLDWLYETPRNTGKPANSPLTLRMTWRCDELGRSLSRLGIASHSEFFVEDCFCPRVTDLTFDCPVDPDEDDDFDCLCDWLINCKQLRELTTGPSPHVCERLFASLPPTLQKLNIVLEASDEVCDAVETAETLVGSAVLISRPLEIDIRVPHPPKGSGRTQEDKDVFSVMVTTGLPNVRRIWSE